MPTSKATTGRMFLYGWGVLRSTGITLLSFSSVWADTLPSAWPTHGWATATNEIGMDQALLEQNQGMHVTGVVLD